MAIFLFFRNGNLSSRIKAIVSLLEIILNFFLTSFRFGNIFVREAAGAIFFEIKLSETETKGSEMIVEIGSIRLTDKLRDWLELKEWTQKRLAAALKVDESTVSHWFDKENPRHPTWKQLIKLCVLTGLDIGDLMTFDSTITKGS